MQGPNKVTLQDALNAIAKDSEGLKCAVGYFYLEGLALIIENLRSMKEIKILMGASTSEPTLSPIHLMGLRCAPLLIQFALALEIGCNALNVPRDGWIQERYHDFRLLIRLLVS